MPRYLALVICLVVVFQAAVAAQWDGGRVDVGGQLAFSRSTEFDDETDIGFGGRVAWLPHPLIGVEAELSVYPDDFPEQISFSRMRVEGLFGATVGPRLGRTRLFARVRPGFIAYHEAPQPLACILIFPPPLGCTLADGRTLFAFDLGGGVEVEVTPRMFIRVDAGDRAVRYPASTGGAGPAAREPFFGHDFRFAIGAGIRVR